jgi:hypothetical protein
MAIWLDVEPSFQAEEVERAISTHVVFAAAECR